MYIFIVLFALLFLFWNGENRLDYKRIGSIFIFFIIVTGALRDATIGTDISLYGSGYHMIWKNPYGYPRDIEPGFLYLTNLIKSIAPSYYLYYSLLYILNILFYCLACRRLGINKILFLAILLISGLLAPSFNVVRQMLALSIGLFVYSCFFSRKSESSFKIKNVFLYEVAIVITAIFFHRSLFLLIIIPCFHIKCIKKTLSNDYVLWGLLALSLFISIFGDTYVQLALAYSEGRFGERADFYANLYQQYADSTDATHGYLTNIINGFLAILLSKKRRDPLFLVGFVGLLLSGISSSGLATLGRVFDNMTIFFNLYLASRWFDLYNINSLITKRVNILKFLRILFWMTSLYYTLFTNDSLNPYKTFLF